MSLPGKTRIITVEPIRRTAPAPQPERRPEKAPEKTPAKQPEKVPA